MLSAASASAINASNKDHQIAYSFSTSISLL